MSGTPVVSYLIPTVHLDAYCARAVKSALADTSAGPVEVCLVVDGAKPAQIPAWATQARVVLGFTGRQLGAGAAINVAKRFASGMYIARLDSDDITYEGRLKQQIQKIEEEGHAAVGACAELIDSEDRSLGKFWVREYHDEREALLLNNPFVHSSLTMRSETFEKVGGYDEDCIRMQDYDLLLRIALIGSLRILPSTLVGYRVHDAQTSFKIKGFVGLMRRIGGRRVDLARALHSSVPRQHVRNVVFVASQLVRYAGLRKPRYLKNHALQSEAA